MRQFCLAKVHHDLGALSFSGLATLTLSGSTGAKATWAPPSPAPKNYRIYLATRDADHAQAALNCALSANATTCRDIIDWTAPYTSALGSVSEITFPSLGDDQTVFLAVRALSQGNVEDSNTVVKSLAMPNAGAPLFDGLAEVTLSSGKARLVWQATVGQTSQFRILTTRSGQTTTTDIAATDGTAPVLAYTTGTLLSTTTYSFAVKAIDRHGNIDSNSVTRTITTGDTSPPGAVQGLAALALSETQVRLSFTTPSDADVSTYVFKAEKCLAPSGSIYAASPACTTWGTKSAVSASLEGGNPGPSAAANALVAGLDGRTLYRFYVSATDGAGNSGPETAKTVATLDTTPPLFSGVGSVIQHPTEPNKVRVTWDSPGGDVARYIVYRALRQNNSCFAGLTLANGVSAPVSASVSSVTITNPETTLYDFSDLTTGGEVWCFTVRAVDEQNNEDTNTASRTYTIPDLTPPAFDANATTVAWSNAADGIQITWTAPSGASQYRIDAQCINAYNCTGESLATCEYPAQTPAGSWPTVDSPWIELALVNAPATTYVLSRLGGGLGECAGAEYRKYRFKVTARKATSDWHVNAVIKPGVSGELISDLSKPAWPTGASLAVEQTGDVPGAESVLVSWNKATELYSSPVRSGSGVAGYDLYLSRTTSPTRVLVKSNIAGIWHSGAGKLQTAITAADMVAACTTASAPADNTCRFELGSTYTFSIRARDIAGNVHLLGDEISSSPKTLSDVTAPVLTQANVSPTSISEEGTATLTFTSSESGTFRILECTGSCGTAGATYASTPVATGTMTTAQKSIPLTLVLFTGGGVKSMAIEIKDGQLNTSNYHAGSTPAVPTLTIVDVTAPLLAQVAVSPSTIETSESANFTFISNESGTYRLLECTAACNTGGATYATLATGSMAASTQKSITIAGTALTPTLGIKNLALELKDSSNNTVTYHGATATAVPAITLTDTTAPTISGVAISPAAIERNGNASLTFTANESGTWRVLECTANCGTSNATYSQVTTGSMTAELQASATIAGTAVTSALGTKNLALEIADASNNTKIYHGSTFPAVPSLQLIDLTAPVLTQVAISSGSIAGSGSADLTFTAGESGTYRVLECTSNCGTVSAAYTQISTGSMSATVQKSVTIAASQLSAGTGVKNLALEFKDAVENTSVYHGATAPAVPTLSISSPTISNVSVSPTTANDGENFSVGFTCGAACSWRILDVTASTVVLATSSGATTTSPVSQSIAASSLSAGSGTKTLAIEVKDPLLNTVTFNNGTTPVVSQVIRNAKPAANVSGFSILRYNSAGVPTFTLSWMVPGSISATDVIEIRKGTGSVPSSCTDGELIATKAHNETFHDTAVGAATVGNVSYAAFVKTTAGLCADGGAESRAVWLMAGSVVIGHTHNSAVYSLYSTQTDANVRIAESRTSAKVTAWDGVNENSSTSICASPTTCSISIADLSYFAVSTEAALSANVARVKTFNYSNAVSNPPWAKRRHRFYFTSLDGKNADLTDVYAWARVPAGMVFVGKENWPNGVTVTGSSPAITESYPTTASSGDWDLVPHDFAIDKYEASLATGTLGAPGAFPNSETGVLVSVAALPLVSENWYAFKQGCLNRSFHNIDDNPLFVATGDLTAEQSKSYSTPNPRRKFHLTTGMEWMIVAYGTPDPSSGSPCNVYTSSALDPSSNNLSCISAFGVRNAIGNVWEWTDDWARNGPRGSMERWVGSTAVQSLLGAAFLTSENGSSGSWNFRGSGRISAGGNVSVSSDGFWRFREDGTTLQGGDGSGRGWAALRGGAWDHGAAAGRFALYLLRSPLSVGTALGGRCALSGPQPRPSLARFGSVSDGSAAKLFWLVHDTENASIVKLGVADTQEEIDAWNGTGAAAGVTVESHAPGVAFTNNCGAGWTPDTGTLYTGHMCDDEITGVNYYKLCITNPDTPQVLDEYSAAERTVCSTPVRVERDTVPPSLAALTSGMKLQNDSDGAFARFYWKESGGTNVVRKFIMGVDKAEVERWNGDAAEFTGWDEGNGWGQATYVGSMGGLKVLSGGPVGNTALTSECALAHLQSNGTTWGAYTPDVGADAAHSTGATHYACVNLSRFPKWSKFWFKVAIASSDNGANNSGNIIGGWQTSEVHSAGYVPTGMVLVAAEEWQSLVKTAVDGDPAEDYTNWPRCVGASGGFPAINAPAHVMPGVTGWPAFAAGVGCVYDFAIDKYEAYNGGGVWGNNAFTAENDFTGNGTTTGVLRSLRNKTAHNNNDWYAFKRGCDNRTAELEGLGWLVAASAAPLNKPRLPTGVEWVVAAAATKDENAQGVCNVQSSAQNAGGTGSLVNCVSRFGSFDHIGNVWEWTDEIRTSTVNPEGNIADMIWKRFLGTVSVTAFPSGVGNGSVPSLINTITSGNVGVWDALTGFPSATGGSKSKLWAASAGDKRVAVRGGAWSNSANAGRFALALDNSPLIVGAHIGGRCALSGQ